MSDEDGALIPNTAAAKAVAGLGVAGTASVLIFLINQFVGMREDITTLKTQQKDFITELREDEEKVLNRLNKHSRRLDDLYRHIGLNPPRDNQ